MLKTYFRGDSMMKTALVSLGVLLLSLGCGASDGPDKPSNTAGTNTGGNGSGGSGAAGGPGGGMANTSGSAQGGSSAGNGTSGSSTGGQAGGSAGGGGAGAGGGGGGGTAKAFECPAGPYEAPVLTGLTATRIPGVPPADAFNNNNNDFTNIEGDVWFEGALYVSEIGGGTNPPPARILKITADDQVSIAMPDSGSNGLAFDAMGQFYGTLHKDGSVSKLDLVAKTATPVVSMFMNARFSSPNDLTFHSNGTLYFTDPSWQAPMPNPQTETRAYWVAPGGQPQAIPGASNNPNGITLSKEQDFLYVAGQNPIKRYPVMADGSLGAGADFGTGTGGIDGMVIDCADNLYAAAGADGVKVFDKTGASLGTIAVAGLGQATNVAFGGADHKTLYVSGQGSGEQKGVFKIAMNVPGYPY
jgi:gluconolactonase